MRGIALITSEAILTDTSGFNTSMNFTETLIKDLNAALNEAVILDVNFHLENATIEITLAPVADDEHNGIRKVNLVTIVLSNISRLAGSFRNGRWDDDKAETIPLSPEGIRENVKQTGQFAIYSTDFIDNKDSYFDRSESRLSFDYRNDAHQNSKHTFEFTRDLGNVLEVKIWFDELSLLDPNGVSLSSQKFIDDSRRAWESPEILKKFGITKPLPEHKSAP